MTSPYVISSGGAGGYGYGAEREASGADMQGNQRPRQGRPPRLPRQLRRGTAVELLFIFWLWRRRAVSAVWFSDVVSLEWELIDLGLVSFDL